MGCSLQTSARAAVSESVASSASRAGWTATTVKLPSVRVPVLSKTASSARSRASR